MCPWSVPGIWFSMISYHMPYAMANTFPSGWLGVKDFHHVQGKLGVGHEPFGFTSWSMCAVFLCYDDFFFSFSVS